MTRDTLTAPLIHPPRGGLPVLLSVPHSGREYPGWLVDMAPGGMAALATLEDPLVDRLVWRALAARCRRGHRPRAARRGRLQPRRGRGRPGGDRGPPPRAGQRARPRRARDRPGRTPHHGYLWRRAIGGAQLEERLDQAHRPYHRAIEDQLAACSSTASAARCCSTATRCRRRADGIPPIVFGDCRGRTAGSWVSGEALAIARARGIRSRAQRAVRRRPRRRAPRRVRRATSTRSRSKSTGAVYLDPTLQDRRDRASTARALLIEALAVGLGELLLGQQFATAAEVSRSTRRAGHRLRDCARRAPCPAAAGARTRRASAPARTNARRSAAACRSGSSSSTRRREARAASLRRPSGSRDRRTAARSPRAGSRPRRPSAGPTS